MAINNIILEYRISSQQVWAASPTFSRKGWESRGRENLRLRKAGCPALLVSAALAATHGSAHDTMSGVPTAHGRISRRLRQPQLITTSHHNTSSSRRKCQTRRTDAHTATQSVYQVLTFFDRVRGSWLHRRS